jgi:hypothetical protein
MNGLLLHQNCAKYIPSYILNLFLIFNYKNICYANLKKLNLM